MIDRELVTRKLVLIAEDLPAAGKVYQALRTAVDDLPQYLDGVRRFLDRAHARPGG